jgi:hypothetical protein
MTQLTCACGTVRLSVERDPILACECCCTSCREAAARLQTNVRAPPMTTAAGATPFVLFRKDRVGITEGQTSLAEFRLTPTSTTRRVLARCCATPLFLEFEQGHWLSLYAALWPVETRPSPTLRTMAGDLPGPARLPTDIPNHTRHSPGFMWKLLCAWVAMGFRSPKLSITHKIQE